jgi:hypothetical protein
MVKRMVIYRLRQLEELGWNDEDLGRALKITKDSVQRLKQGRAEISATTELELRKILSGYVRKRMMEAGVVPPRRVRTERLPAPPRPIEPPSPDRGVYLEDIPAPGETWYKIVLANGKVGTVHLPNELVDAGLYQNLCRRLDMLDPAQNLKAI